MSHIFDRPSQMRFTMSTDEKKSSDVPTSVTAQPEIPSALVGKSRKNYVVIAVTGVVVVALVLIAILVGMHLFTETEKEIIKISLQLKNNMTQEVTSNPSTNVVLFHVNELNQETWIVDDFNSDLKVMKVQRATGTNCYITPLNESSPMDLPKMESEMNQMNNTGMVSVGYVTNHGSPIKDNSFLPKAARDICNGISTYWLYPKCENAVDKIPDPSKDRVKRGTNSAVCNGWLYESSCSITDYTCTAHSGNYCLTRTGSYYCYTFTWWFSWWDWLWFSCRMYRCDYPSGQNCVRV